MRSTTVGLVLLISIAVSLLVLVSCPTPTADTADTDPVWTFDADEEGWAKQSYDSGSINNLATLTWTAAAGSPSAGALQVVVPFDGTEWQYVTIAAPITANPLSSGIDLTGKKFSALVKSAVSFTGGVMISSTSPNATPPPDWASGNGSLVALSTTDWVSPQLEFDQFAAPYDATDVRFLSVLIATAGVAPPAGDYTFYIDTAVIEDAP